MLRQVDEGIASGVYSDTAGREEGSDDVIRFCIYESGLKNRESLRQTAKASCC